MSSIILNADMMEQDDGSILLDESAECMLDKIQEIMDYLYARESCLRTKIPSWED